MFVAATKKILLFSLVLIFSFSGAMAAPQTPTAEDEAILQELADWPPDKPIDMEKLLDGEILTYILEFPVEGEGVKKRVVGLCIIDAPVNAVWDILADWDAMGSFVPTLQFYKTVHQLQPKDEKGVYENLIRGQIKVLLFKVPYTLAVIFDEENLRQDWRLVDDDEAQAFIDEGVDAVKPFWALKSIAGFGYIKPFGESKTIYLYSPVIESSVPVPASIERYAAKQSLLGYMKAIQDKAAPGKR
ncbi:MAG: SRPBCC family protein [Desulfatibacillaceae bacterium]|nr:SRPBCC family protein [Desulfatibacillaceae bacterium]